MMNWTSCLQSVVLILCCLNAECKDVEAFLKETKNFSAVIGERVQLKCKLRTGSIVQSNLRQWHENDKLIINRGTLANSNSGYKEKVESSSFTLTTPAVNDSFLGYKYSCSYLFDQSDFYLIEIQVKPTSEACTGSFHCGFWLVLLIVVVACVIICILVWKKDLKIRGFFQRKEINVAIFIGVPITVAVVIAVILGIKMECLICVIAVVVSIGVGLFIVVVLLIFIIVWNCKKEFYRAVINITSVSYTDDLGDCKSEAYKNLSHRVIKAIEFLYKNVEGQQTVMEINFSPGLMVTFDLSSQGFSDCSVLSDTLKNALQKGDISSFNVSSVGFEFMPLQDWKDSKGETSDRSNGDRARSPASASAVKVEAENKSHIKPTGKKTEESSLHIKSYGSPLPEVPKVRHNQLDPIGEVDNKPYTKLYGSPLPEVPQVRSNQLDRIERQDIDEAESPKVEKKKKKKKKNRKKNEDSVDNEEDN